jgi:hypothetical protein
MPKSKVRKKNGKKVKYNPKPTGLSKTKMKKLMEMISGQQKSMQDAGQDNVVLEISEDFSNKINLAPTDEISTEGPSLSYSEENLTRNEG